MAGIIISVWGELRRRNVLRVGIAYLAAIWLVLQIADLILSNFAAPGWVIQSLIYAAALGFPVVLVISWFYEMTPEGIRPDTGAASRGNAAHSVGRKIDFVIIGFLLLAVGFFAVDFERPEQESGRRYARNKPPIPQIAEELGVEPVMEGSVRFAGDRIRVTAQLIDAASDQHIWSETYDSDFADGFGVESDIAKSRSTPTLLRPMR